MCCYCGFLMTALFWFNLLPIEFKCSTPTLFLLQFSVIYRVLFLCIQCFSLPATLWWYWDCATLFLPMMQILLFSCYEINVLYKYTVFTLIQDDVIAHRMKHVMDRYFPENWNHGGGSHYVQRCLTFRPVWYAVMFVHMH